MKKFEHLFSQDPIAAFDKIEEDYIRYFEAAFRIDDNDLNKERLAALKKNEYLSKEPYIEVLPEYSPVQGMDSMEKLVNRFATSFGNRELSRLFFEGLVSKGLMRGVMKDYLPYGHQIGMLEKAFAGMDEKGNPLKYRNTVITSGTGSGKTESFLLPLLADIFKEAKNSPWGAAVDHSTWYEGVFEGKSKKRRYVPSQRENDPRPAAIRALILYPMNALVEDQMARLREALDSNEVRLFMKSHLGNNRIYFGSYNGSTIAPKSFELLRDFSDGSTFRKKKEEVAQQLKKIHDDFEFISNCVNRDPQKKEALYISPRLGGDNTTGEMVTRWDMQHWAPDILITNTSMLSIMLMRRAERKMFEDTKHWLAADDVLNEKDREKAKKDRVLHIVVDELHLYRGTAGSEVACLLRLLYKAVGLDPVIDDGRGNKVPNPQIRILASSASLGDEKATQRFLEEFFGIYSTIESETVFNVQPGTNYTGKYVKDEGINYESFSYFNHENFIAIELGAKNAGDVVARRHAMCVDFVSKHFGCNTLEEFCEKYDERIYGDFYNILPINTDGSRRPISQSQLIASLFNRNEEAFRGFLIFRGYIDSQIKKHRLPRFRFHKFFKYVEGLWAELNPSLSKDVPPVRNLSYNSKETGARAVLELLRCENCGQLFIGGNRKRDEESGSISLTLNYPNLEQIPNFNPTPMVQNKSYLDYAIFWPQDVNRVISIPTGRVNEGAADHVVVMGTAKTSYDNGKAKWIPGYLDSLSGKFIPGDRALLSGTASLAPAIKANGIQGFLYTVVDRNNREIDEERAERIFAAPCACPNCLQDYTLRKYSNSPIRSFRTGIDRSNQILSKELLYQLDERSSKLIGFSDSREEAAKQALGIEKEHYRDMVRMLFVECIEDIGKDVRDVEAYVMSEKKRGVNDLDILVDVQKRFPGLNEASSIAKDLLQNKSISAYITDSTPLSDIVGDNIDGKLVIKLLENGINPAGEAYKYQWYEKDNAQGLFHWSTAYDFKSNRLVSHPHFKDNTYRVQIRKQLENAVFANSFGKYMGVSVLDAGIGYIGGPKSEEITRSSEYKNLRSLLPAQTDVFEFVDATIRVMGDNYLYPSNDDTVAYTDYDHLKGSVKKAISEFCKRNKVNEPQLGKALVKYLKKYCTDATVLSLELDKLYFTKMAKDRYIRCSCGRVHPDMGFGFCTNTSCMAPLDPSKTVETDALHDHYISFDILKERKAARRLHTEELSGQTDDIQSRLREFKGLILVDDGDPARKGLEKTKPIDMICVTTTMEVGVDIGSLQAIFQGNMPPTRYNYQQRVGRGGRRGQAFSVALTFCRGRSHDVYYYEKTTDEMVGGIPATPTLSLAPFRDTDGTMKMKKAIMKRVVVKEILRKAFLNLNYQIDLMDTAGEFGRVGEWPANKTKLEEWITTEEKDIADIVRWFFGQFNTNNQIENDIEDLIEWIKKDLVGKIDTAVSKTSNLEMGLARYLSESGFLPMYGMPSDTRNFYHGFDSERKRVRSMDRSSEMAISEFAPGSEKTKDKGKYRVEGLTLPMKEEANDQGQISFFNSAEDALSDRYVLSYIKKIGENDNNIKEITDISKNIPSTQVPLGPNQRLIVIPQAYRSLAVKKNTGTPVDNNDRGSSFAQSQVFARDNGSVLGSINKKTINNVDISIYEMGLNEDPTVWHINNNNNKFYTGSYLANGLGDPYGTLANFMFYDCDKVDGGNRTEVKRKRSAPGSNTMDIALGSKKITEMIKIELLSYPEAVNLSLTTGNRSAIRAAFYSAAFLLQRALADKLDVQPDEI